jgi:hypothetical protein
MMGWTTAQVGEASLWKFSRAFEGWRGFHAAPTGPGAPSDDEFDQAVAAART